MPYNPRRRRVKSSNQHSKCDCHVQLQDYEGLLGMIRSQVERIPTVTPEVNANKATTLPVPQLGSLENLGMGNGQKRQNKGSESDDCLLSSDIDGEDIEDARMKRDAEFQQEEEELDKQIEVLREQSSPRRTSRTFGELLFPSPEPKDPFSPRKGNFSFGRANLPFNANSSFGSSTALDAMDDTSDRARRNLQTALFKKDLEIQQVRRDNAQLQDVIETIHRLVS
jgi:hypothetical protein